MGDELTYYSSRPVVSVGGQREQQVSDELLSLLVEETIDGLFRCELKVGNWGVKNGAMDFLFFDRQKLEFGADLSVELGPPGKSRKVFSGRITGIEGEFPTARPPEITVLAEDKLQDLRMTRHTRSFEDVSDSDVVSQVASAHGLSPQVDYDGPTYKVITQVNQSDLAFLRDRARAADALLRVEDQSIHFQARERAREESIEMAYGRELRELTVLADLALQRTRVRVTGWDVSSKSAVSGVGDASVVSGELGELTGGGSILSQKFSDRVEQLSHLVPFADGDAKSLAQARYREVARRFLTGVAHADGDGRVRVGAEAKLSGLGNLFDGKYTVVAVRHTFDGSRGYRTTFQVQRAGIGS